MKSEITSLKQASIVKRLVAVIMDGAVTIFTFFAFFLFVFSPIATHAFGYKDLVKEGSDTQLASHLYVLINEDDGRNTPINQIDGEELSFYLEKIKYYYCEYKTGKAKDKAPDYNVEIEDDNGNKVLPINYYTEEWFASKTAEVTTVAKAQDLAVEALVDFSKYVADISRKIKQCELFIILPSYFISFGVYFILFPLIFKSGETLGKKTMGLGFVGLDTYQVKKRQIVFRQLFLLLYVTFFTFTIAVGVTSFATLGLGVAIYFIATFISKKKRSLADWVSYTYLIDINGSIFFANKEEEMKKAKEIEDNLAKLNKSKELDKNILQVGSTIVNEEAKKEIENLEQTNDKKE